MCLTLLLSFGTRHVFSALLRQKDILRPSRSSKVRHPVVCVNALLLYMQMLNDLGCIACAIAD